MQQRVIEMLQSNMCSPEGRNAAEQQLGGLALQTLNPFCAKGQSPAPSSNALRMHTFLYGIISMLIIAVYFIWEN